MRLAKIDNTYINLNKVSSIDINEREDDSFELIFFFGADQFINDACKLVFSSESDGALEFRDWIEKRTVSKSFDSHKPDEAIE